jgi:hypothetical protein
MEGKRAYEPDRLQVASYDGRPLRPLVPGIFSLAALECANARNGIMLPAPLALSSLEPNPQLFEPTLRL